jgi:hypothetical protein
MCLDKFHNFSGVAFGKCTRRRPTQHMTAPDMPVHLELSHAQTPLRVSSQQKLCRAKQTRGGRGALERIVARVAIARIEDEEEGEEGGGNARQLPRHRRHLDVRSIHI